MVRRSSSTGAVLGCVYWDFMRHPAPSQLPPPVGPNGGADNGACRALTDASVARRNPPCKQEPKVCPGWLTAAPLLCLLVSLNLEIGAMG